MVGDHELCWMCKSWYDQVQVGQVSVLFVPKGPAARKLGCHAGWSSSVNMMEPAETSDSDEEYYQSELRR